MNYEEQNKNPDVQKNGIEVIQSSLNKEVMQKTIEECLSDTNHQANELLDLYDSITLSFVDFDKLIEDYREELKILKEKRFHINKPLSIYRLEEKIDIFESYMDIYRRSFSKIDKDIREILGGFYDNQIPAEEAKTIKDREKYFSKIYKDAIKELQNRKEFYRRIKEANKTKHG